MVAQFLATPEQLYLAWTLGGVLSFVGGLLLLGVGAGVQQW